MNDFRLSHVEYHVGDLSAAAAELTERYGFRASPVAGRDALTLRQGGITLVLTAGERAAGYVAAHGYGVADIALAVPDVAGAFADVVSRGAVPVAEPSTGPDGVTTAAIRGFGDVVHTLTDAVRPAGEVRSASEVRPASEVRSAAEIDLLAELDHFAVCLPAGELDSTVDFYTEVLGFRMIFTEVIRVGTQAMNSKVVQSVSGEITLTLIEPSTEAEPGQIDGFLRQHGGAGVQHIAFATRDIVEGVGTLAERGVEFLSTPDAYYDRLAGRIDLTRHSTSQLRELNVLVDEDHDGQLFQIFTRSTHPNNTLFYEVIERRGASTFGSGNIKALYEAVEAERLTAAGTSR